MADFDIFKHIEEQSKEKTVSINIHTELGQLVQRQVQLEDNLKEAERKVTGIKLDIKKVSEEQIPELMKNAGVKELVLKDGSKIKVSKSYYPSIEPDNKQKAFAWFRKNGFKGIIKHEISATFNTGRDTDALKLKEKLNKEGVVYSEVESINTQTLKATVRKEVEKGTEFPEFIGTYNVEQAKITRKGK